MENAVSQNWPLFQLYINTSFLHDDLNEEVYMQVHHGLDLPQPKMVLKLKRSLYRLKQENTQWNTSLVATLLNSGYIQSKSDYSLFTKTNGAKLITILVYIDDLLLCRTNIAKTENIKTSLNDKFNIKDLGILKYFLDFEVARTKDSISLCEKYTLNLLQDIGVIEVKPCNTHMQSHLQFHKNSSQFLTKHATYRRLIGRLLYITHYIVEISYIVSKLSQLLATPTDEHMLAGLHVLKYLKNNLNNSLFFSSSSTLVLKGFSDSN